MTSEPDDSSENVRLAYMTQLLSDLVFYEAELTIISERMLLMEKKLAGTDNFQTLMDRMNNLLTHNTNELHSLKAYFSQQPDIMSHTKNVLNEKHPDTENIRRQYQFFNQQFSEMREFFNKFISS